MTRRDRRPVLWGGRARDWQVGGPEDRARSLILNGTAAYRRAAVTLIRELQPTMRQALNAAASMGRALRAAGIDVDEPIRSRPDHLRRFRR